MRGKAKGSMRIISWMRDLRNASTLLADKVWNKLSIG
jgi:hypothetical protein